MNLFYRIINGAISFEKMDEAMITEFVMNIIGRFETMQAAFTSITRDLRNQTIKPRGSTFSTEDVPPVGTYRPKHEIVEKRASNAFIISPTGASKGKLFEVDESMASGNLHNHSRTLTVPDKTLLLHSNSQSRFQNNLLGQPQSMSTMIKQAKIASGQHAGECSR